MCGLRPCLKCWLADPDCLIIRQISANIIEFKFVFLFLLNTIGTQVEDLNIFTDATPGATFNLRTRLYLLVVLLNLTKPTETCLKVKRTSIKYQLVFKTPRYLL